MSDRQAEIRRLIVQLQDEKRQKLTAQRILRAAQEEHRLDVDDLETRLTDLQQDYEFNHKQGTWYRHGRNSTRRFYWFNFVREPASLGIRVFSDSARLYRRYEEICGGSGTSLWYECEVNGCFSPFCLPSPLSRLYGIFEAAENPLKFEIIV